MSDPLTRAKRELRAARRYGGSPYIALAPDEIDALLAAEQEKERLMSDLVFYGEHRHDCGSVTAEVPWDCDCGFSAALASPREEQGQ